MIEMKQCGQLITEEEAEHYQKILKQKAEKINIKLNNQLDPASDAEEDQVVVEQQEDLVENMDLDRAIAMIEQQQFEIIEIDKLPPIQTHDIEKMILSE